MNASGQTPFRSRSNRNKSSIFGLCLDWRIVGSLFVVGLGIYLVRPSVIAAIWPFFLYALCPLSMLLMMKSMGSMQPSASPNRNQVQIMGPELEELQTKHAALIAKLESDGQTDPTHAS